LIYKKRKQTLNDDISSYKLFSGFIFRQNMHHIL